MSYSGLGGIFSVFIAASLGIDQSRLELVDNSHLIIIGMSGGSRDKAIVIICQLNVQQFSADNYR